MKNRPKDLGRGIRIYLILMHLMIILRKEGLVSAQKRFFLKRWKMVDTLRIVVRKEGLPLYLTDMPPWIHIRACACLILLMDCNAPFTPEI
jgi:hypothetical protein